MLLMVFGLLWLGFTLIAKANEPEPEPPAIVETEPESIPAEPVVLEIAEEPIFEEPEVDWAVQEQLAVGIYREGGGDSVCDDCRVRIADVMLNRVADPRFPDTLREVLTQKGQYGTMHTDGITFPKRAAQPEEFHAVQRAYDIAEEVMGGRHSELYGQGYIYQSEFPDLGHDAFEHCGIYFAKG
jgi:hypothetical protein